MTKIWEAMNDLEMVVTKVCSAREIIDVAVEAIQKNENSRAETLAMAAYEFLGYYLDEFDKKFKAAWQETVVKPNQEESDAYDSVIKEREYYEPSMPPWGQDDFIGDCMPPWGHSDMEALKYTDKELDAMCDNADKIEKEKLVRSWHISVEEAYNKDGETIFSYLQFPDSLLERMELKEGSKIQWIVNPDGTVVIRKI